VYDSPYNNLTKLAKDAVVEEVYAKITSLDIAGKTFCESSTIHPDMTKKIEQSVLAKNAGFVAGISV
jgi:3-hydroxyisobutyrate dehydrogenase-like beta-hydroxyacid dehydrogenase